MEEDENQRNNQLEEDDKRLVEEFLKRRGREATKRSREES